MGNVRITFSLDILFPLSSTMLPGLIGLRMLLNEIVNNMNKVFIANDQCPFLFMFSAQNDEESSDADSYAGISRLLFIIYKPFYQGP